MLNFSRIPTFVEAETMKQAGVARLKLFSLKLNGYNRMPEHKSVLAQ